MKKYPSRVAGCLLAVSVLLSSGCLRALRLGAADGVNSAISAAVEAIITQALDPITSAE